MNNNDIQILITAGLNQGSSVQEIKANIKQLQKVVNKQQLNLKINIDNSALKQIQEFNKRMEDLGSRALNTKKLIEETINPDGSKYKVTHFGDGSIGTSFDEAKVKVKDFNKEVEKGLEVDKQREKNLQYEHKVRDSLAKQEIKNREKALQYEQKTKKAIEDNSKKLEHQLEIYKKQAQLNEQNLKRTHKTTVNRGALDEYLDSVKKLRADTPDLNKQMQNLNMQFKQISTNAKSAAGAVAQSGMSIAESFQTAMVNYLPSIIVIL